MENRKGETGHDWKKKKKKKRKKGKIECIGGEIKYWMKNNETVLRIKKKLGHWKCWIVQEIQRNKMRLKKNEKSPKKGLKKHYWKWQRLKEETRNVRGRKRKKRYSFL